MVTIEPSEVVFKLYLGCVDGYTQSSSLLTRCVTYDFLGLEPACPSESCDCSESKFVAIQQIRSTLQGLNLMPLSDKLNSMKIGLELDLVLCQFGSLKMLFIFLLVNF